MNFYWIYDIPSLALFILIVGGLITFNLFSLIVLRKLIAKHIMHVDDNEEVSYFLGTFGAIYGITLGLIAVATWETYTDVEKSSSEEAAAISALYRDINYFPSPLNDSLKLQLKTYTINIIESWDLQKKGQIPSKGTEMISKFQKTLYLYNPTDNRMNTIYTETISQFNKVIEMRRMRLHSITSGLPSLLWYIILFGAIVTNVTTWFFQTDRFRVHIIMVALFSALLGSLIFLVASLDNPYRGGVSVSSQAFEIVLNSLMK